METGKTGIFLRAHKGDNAGTRIKPPPVLNIPVMDPASAPEIKKRNNIKTTSIIWIGCRKWMVFMQPKEFIRNTGPQYS